VNSNLPPGCNLNDEPGNQPIPPECEACEVEALCPGEDKCSIFKAAQAARDKEAGEVADAMARDLRPTCDKCGTHLVPYEDEKGNEEHYCPKCEDVILTAPPKPKDPQRTMSKRVAGLGRTAEIQGDRMAEMWERLTALEHHQHAGVTGEPVLGTAAPAQQASLVYGDAEANRRKERDEAEMERREKHFIEKEQQAAPPAPPMQPPRVCYYEGGCCPCCDDCSWAHQPAPAQPPQPASEPDPEYEKWLKQYGHAETKAARPKPASEQPRSVPIPCSVCGAIDQEKHAAGCPEKRPREGGRA
jgi:hypothetical protein